MSWNSDGEPFDECDNGCYNCEREVSNETCRICQKLKAERRSMITNYEHHKDWFETNKFKLLSSDGYAVDNKTHEPDFCAGKNCDECIFGEVVGSCHEARVEWLNAEYVEPPVDWSKVPVDTKIEVKCDGYGYWTRRHFAKYVNGRVLTWDGGRTSYTAYSDNDTTSWDCARLYKEETDE